MLNLLHLFDETVAATDLTVHVSAAGVAPVVAPATAGIRVLDLIRAAGLPIKAECGGSGVCATCHVRISPEWHDRLPPPSHDEVAKLDEIPTADALSRLACQLVMAEALDGLELEIQPDSLLQTPLKKVG